MAEQSRDWVAKHWAQLVGMAFAISAFCTVQITTGENTKKADANTKSMVESALLINDLKNESREHKDKNYKLYLQVQELRTDNKNSSKDVEIALTNLSLNVNTLVTKFELMDSRYVKYEQIDSRLLKTAYRGGK